MFGQLAVDIATQIAVALLTETTKDVHASYGVGYYVLVRVRGGGATKNAGCSIPSGHAVRRPFLAQLLLGSTVALRDTTLYFEVPIVCQR